MRWGRWPCRQHGALELRCQSGAMASWTLVQILVALLGVYLVGAQNSSYYATGGSGFMLMSNYTTDAISVATAGAMCYNGAPSYPVVEATISSIHQAMLGGRLTCSQLVGEYLQRIQAYDKPTGLNTYRLIAPDLSQVAAQKDAQLSQARATNQALPALFCVPFIVKDNFDTAGMAATAGAVALLDNYPAQDAQQVAKLKAAGAVLLGKGNMGEWAFSPTLSLSSVAGAVRNPYDLDRTPAGSSGGPSAAVAANLALVGLGTDTGNSVRGPASHCNLVGMRPTLGLTSRSGIIPLDNTSDIAGPIARTVEDVARMLEALVGVDPSDPLTGLSKFLGSAPANYTGQLSRDALKGARIGVMRQTINTNNADGDVMMLFGNALTMLQQQGATLVDPFVISGNSLGAKDWDGRSNQWYTGSGDSGHWEDINCGAHFKYDLNNYLNTAGTKYRNVQDIANQGLYHPSVNLSIAARVIVNYTPQDYPTDAQRSNGFICGCTNYYNNPCRAEFRKRLIESMNNQNVDVIVFPTWSNPPRLIGDYYSCDGNNSPQIAPPTGAPAITVPMGYARDVSQSGLPAGLQFLARPWDEGRLLRIAYAYEQATQFRLPPPIFPECSSSPGPSAAPYTSPKPGSGIAG
ncbi:hypothetical protein CVIRNUC_010831 [Coccomyxa viridis]|uniref:Amidase domain-containing protein n=1 Tax=Coccomyxa viridis TaxID=1274662 RepID=A0AAV1INN2_9CHLO|nr:hypothetical protein CVIRNUC_010831 [Coccomyxa viridis]